MDDDLERVGEGSASCDQLRRYHKRQHPLGNNKKKNTSNKPNSVRYTDEEDVGMNASALPSLSSTNYGGMYVISSYKDNISTR